MTKSEMDALWRNLDKACGGITATNDRLYFLAEDDELKTSDGLAFKHAVYEAVRQCSIARLHLRDIRDRMNQ